MNVLSGKAVQKCFIEEWEVPSYLSERQERCKVGQARELSAMTLTILTCLILSAA